MRAGLNRAFTHDPALTEAFKPLRDISPVIDKRVNAVVIGGGTGAPVSIKTLLSMGLTTSAVVAMADDGGSTGILRDQAHVTTPGDIRKCIAAMAANPDDPMTKAFRYRFPFADNHTLGNLMLSALEDATGSFPEAIHLCENLVQARGHVYPSTLSRVQLVARTIEGTYLEGQAVACHSRCALQRVKLQCDTPIVAYEGAVQAILEADLIVLGPGSVFTSIIPNLLVPGVVDAIRRSSGKTVFVCSLADMQGETRGMGVRQLYEALADHGMQGLLDYILVHQSNKQPYYRDVESPVVRPVAFSSSDREAISFAGTEVLVYDFVDPHLPTWHNPSVLRQAFTEVLRRCLSPQM